MTPRLWSWNLSPFAAKARIAFAVRRIEHELLEVDPLNRPKRLAELNPSRTVPTLELDGGVGIFQSTAICEWAEEVGSGPSLWPADPGLRARARGLLRWVDDEITVNFFLSMRKTAYGLDERLDHPNLVGNLQDALVKRWRGLERLLAATDGPWLLGSDGPLLPDLAGLPVAVRLPAWAPKLAPDPAEQPATAAWLDALRALPEAAEVDRAGAPVTT